MEFDWVIGSSGQPESLNILLIFPADSLLSSAEVSPVFKCRLFARLRRLHWNVCWKFSQVF